MNRERYERPVIIRHQAGLANKIGRSRAPRSMGSIDGVSVAGLAGEFGSPLFVFSEKRIRKNYREAHRAFSMRYPGVKFAWSYKTNYLDAVCRIFHDEGSWAEVVSEYEYDMARRNGVPGAKILYNGPYKPVPALERAVAEGAHIHIDNYDELLAMEKIAAGSGKRIEAAIRINLDAGIHPAWDRFGFNYENGEARDAARRMRAGGKLVLAGVHAHIGTCILDPAAYRTQTEKLVEFSLWAGRELGCTVKYIDAGGGFPSSATLHEQYLPGDEANPPIDEYAEAVTAPLLAAGFSPDRLPALFLETGRALVDDAGFLVCSVVANKRLAGGTRAVIVDAGVNALFTSFWYKHNVFTAEEHSGMMEETAIYGPLCMNIDVLRPSLRLPSLDPGDILVFTPAGAYNVTQWMQFIRMRPPVVMIGEGGGVRLIRRAETLEDLKGPETAFDDGPAYAAAGEAHGNR